MATSTNDTSTKMVTNSNNDNSLYSETKGKGLANLSNTCYLNSAVQSFLHAGKLSEWFLMGEFKEDLNEEKHEKYAVQAWNMLVNEYFKSGKEKVLSPYGFHKVINYLANEKGIPLYQLGNQNDIHEFILFFISVIHDATSYPIKASIKGTVKSNLDRLTLTAHKQWATVYRREYSSMIDMFYGQFISTIICPDCNHGSTSFEPECCFQLPIPIKKKNHKRPIDLIDCWQKFTEIETVDKDNMITCDKCKEPKKMTKQMALWKTPEILIILLKRFRTQGIHAHKINELVTYPLELDLSDFCSSYDKLQSTYSLFSVCNHQGVTGGGHYFAYCKDVDGKWRKYNDSIVSDVEPKDVITKDAYCLFYQKK